MKFYKVAMYLIKAQTDSPLSRTAWSPSMGQKRHCLRSNPWKFNPIELIKLWWTYLVHHNFFLDKLMIACTQIYKENLTSYSREELNAKSIACCIFIVPPSAQEAAKSFLPN